jgi:O-antigen/teichoic acid export membrane protein
MQDHETVILSRETQVREPVGNGFLSLARLWQLRQSDLFQKISQTYATQVLNITVSLATAVIIARSLGPRGRGIYSVAIAISTLGVQLGNLGLHFSNTYHVAKNRDLLSVLFGNTLFMSFGLGGLIAIFGWTLFRVVPLLAPVQGTPLVIGLLWIPFGLALLLTENLLLGIHEVRSFNVIEALNKIAALALAVATILVVRPSVEWFLMAGFSALLLSLGIAVFKVSRFVPGWPRFSLRVLRDSLPVSVRAYFILLFSFLVLRIDLLMVKYMRGAEQAGYYSIAANMADVCLALPMVFAAILFPKLCSMGDLRQRLALTRRAGLGVALALCLILVVACVMATPLVTLVFGKPFLPSASAFVWLAPGILTLGAEIVIVQFLNSVGLPVSVVAVWIVSTMANILGNLWAIPRFGIVGASAVSSISYSLTFALIVMLIVRTRSRLGATV